MWWYHYYKPGNKQQREFISARPQQSPKCCKATICYSLSTKPKGWLLTFEKKVTTHSPVYISGAVVQWLAYFWFLVTELPTGMNITDKLSQSSHIQYEQYIEQHINGTSCGKLRRENALQQFTCTEHEWRQQGEGSTQSPHNVTDR